MAQARLSHTATLLPDGTVLVAGGRSSGAFCAGSELASVEIYDPATGTFSPTGSMAQARSNHTATRLLDGTVLVAGGVPPESAVAGKYDDVAAAVIAPGSMDPAVAAHPAAPGAGARA